MTCVLVYGNRTIKSDDEIMSIFGTRYLPWEYTQSADHEYDKYWRLYVIISDNPETIVPTLQWLVQIRRELQFSPVECGPIIIGIDVEDRDQDFWITAKVALETELITFADVTLPMDIGNYRIPARSRVNVYHWGDLKYYWQIDRMQKGIGVSDHGTIVRADRNKVKWDVEIVDCRNIIICVFRAYDHILTEIFNLVVTAKKMGIKLNFILIKHGITGDERYMRLVTILGGPPVTSSRSHYNYLTAAVRHHFD